MGEAKRRKQILGDTYGTSATVKQAIQLAKKKNDALLPSTFIPDFGLEVSAQIGEEPFHFTALELKDLKVIEDAKFGRLAINFIPLQFSITHVNVAANLPIIMRETMITLEIYTLEESKVDGVIEALSSGIDVKANWSKRFFTAHPVHKELVVPIHIMPYEEDRLGLQHIANHI
ncbi:Protein of unknown function DUF2839 (plasmid) [Nostoc flagelliforme CCNUN1]|uniref:Uncharacterized protein n=1 Tax=Nostoc flagelliforme CCNUN1 TaxID=2038116 RepID=A0A2K8T5N3_9NOSO|nr:DUF2839 family protein [Nostoc flagelliforme]AUB42969.1 Protein of unknown function DUF2839 [Nostoc flagelliforme CCNUN1]